MNEPLVFLPGMMCDARLFLPQIAAFSKKVPILVMPLYGHDTIAGLARHILHLAPPKFSLAGLSMGGIVAMEIMRQMPQRVVRLALIDTNPMADATDRAAIRQKQIKQVQAGKLRSVMRDEMKPNYLAKGSERARILKLCMDMAEALGPAVFTEQSIALKYRRDQCETLKAINVPTDIICGEDDRLCPVSRHEFMHDLIAGSTLSIIPGAGHLPTLEQPKMTNRILEKWLRM